MINDIEAAQIVLSKIKEDTQAYQLALKSSFLLYLQTMFLLINERKITLKPFHREVIAKLEDIVFQRNKKRNLILNIPVGAGKSLLAEYFISWCFARDINHAFIYVSHGDRLIMKLSNETKDICAHSAWRILFGGSFNSDSKANWSFSGAKNRTGLMAGTTGGAITGLDAGNPIIDGFSGALIIDDPIDAGKARYENSRQEAIDFYAQKLKTRRRTPQTPTILIMQRLHKEDLAGYVMDVDEEEWEQVKIPALNEKDESFWEERYPIKDMLALRRTNPFIFSGQYQQEPIQTGGSVIQIKWFEYFQDYTGIKPDKFFFTGDTAQKVKEHNDYSVMCAWFVYQNSLHLLDMVRGKWESPELRKTAIAFWNKWRVGLQGKKPNLFYIEDKASGTGLIQDLKRDTCIPIKAVQRDKDKLTRVEDVLPYIECGRVKLFKNAEWSYNVDILAECEEFRRDNSHKHDDIIDNLCDGIDQGLCIGKSSILDNL